MIKKLSRKIDEYGRVFILNEAVKDLHIERSLYKSNYFIENNKVEALCINCNEKPCYRYDSIEIDCLILEGLPYNNDKRVCPTNAIDIQPDNTLKINDNCISCGLCIVRCPIGGVILDEDNGYNAKFKVDNNIHFTEAKEDSPKLNSLLCKVTSNQYLQEKLSVTHLNKLNKHFLRKSQNISDFDLIITRNLFLQLGINNKVAAKGNNDNRFDLLGKINSFFIVAEIDFKGDDFLSLERKILENISILNNRYGKKINVEIIPIMVILSFPNKRSDYYEVTQDVKNVLGIEIYSIPVHFLLIFTWLDFKITHETFKKFYIDIQNRSLENAIKDLIGNIDILDPLYGNTSYKHLK